ncbi:hypothetical protein B0T21DRAFT_351238 [Apiosordaria backusii]|uniref:Uncharacterized protein n=1 Tax=Apiosordaria backusii TaxID=314023 RepID=A0AA40ASR7_9PEZI|nr:hypothetical protein B0T21DRAFT_351238 [Apiosordaria backusii]
MVETHTVMQGTLDSIGPHLTSGCDELSHIHQLQTNILRKSIQCFGDPDCEAALLAVQDPSSGIGESLPGNAFVNVRAPNVTNNDKHPVLVMAGFPYLNHQENKVEQAVLACIVMAHWIPAAPVRVSLNGSEFIEELSGYEINSPDDVRDGARMVKITDGWLPYLNRVLEADVESQNDTETSNSSRLSNAKQVIDRLIAAALTTAGLSNGTAVSVFGPGAGNAAPGLDFDKMRNSKDTEDFTLFSTRAFVEKLLSAVFVDGLARVQSHGHSQLTISSNDTAIVATHLDLQAGPMTEDLVLDRSNGTGVARQGKHTQVLNYTLEWTKEQFQQRVHFPLEAEQYGYGFGKPTEGMKFALAVMYTYLLILLVCIIWLLPAFLFGKNRGARINNSWGDLQNLLVLAWNSESHVTVAGRGADKKIWDIPTAIQEGHSTIREKFELVGRDRVGKEALIQDTSYP